MPEWQALGKHAVKMKKLHLRDLFAADPECGRRFAVEAEGIRLDYSKHPVTAETMELLIGLARACGLGSGNGCERKRGGQVHRLDLCP